MTTNQILKRIDNLEIRLTPKEWAIRLADELRKYPSEDEFHYSFLNYSSPEETPFGKPFFMLNKQAEEQHPGHKPDDIRAQYRIAWKLRGEYQAFRLLINQSNEKMKHKSEILKLKASLQLSIMNALILQDIVAMANTIKGNDLAEQTYDLGFPSMLEDWMPKTFELIIDFYLFDAVVRIVQDKYLDGHPFIFRDVENRLSETRIMIEDADVTFNEYLKKLQAKIKTVEDKNGTKDTAGFLNRFALDIEGTKNRFDQKSIIAIADKWAKDAKDKAIVEILDGMGKHEEASDFLWKLAREEIKANQANQEEPGSIHIVVE